MISGLEWAANGVVTISILLAGRNSWHTWWTGILGCMLFGALFYQAQLFADVVLQIFFIAASCIGWWQWKYGAAGKPRAISFSRKLLIVQLVPAGIVCAILYGYLLHRFTSAFAPFVDSMILVFSVIAQILLMRRHVECWWFWLLVNTIAVPLYFSRELYVTSVLYACYWVNALIALNYWGKCVNDHSQNPKFVNSTRINNSSILSSDS